MDNDDIKDLNCEKCKQIFKAKPTRLPCGKVVCKNHLQNNKNRLQCDFCFSDDNQSHDIKEVNVDKKLLKKLNLHNFDKNYRLILQHIIELTILLSRPYIQIHDYFGNFINEIDIQMVLAYIHLEKAVLYGAMMLYLDDIEKDCFEMLDLNEIQDTHIVMDQVKTLIDQVNDNDQITNSLISKYEFKEQLIRNRLTTMKKSW